MRLLSAPVDCSCESMDADENFKVLDEVATEAGSVYLVQPRSGDVYWWEPSLTLDEVALKDARERWVAELPADRAAQKGRHQVWAFDVDQWSRLETHQKEAAKLLGWCVSVVGWCGVLHATFSRHPLLHPQDSSRVEWGARTRARTFQSADTTATASSAVSGIQPC